MYIYIYIYIYMYYSITVVSLRGHCVPTDLRWHLPVDARLSGGTAQRIATSPMDWRS